MSPYRKYNWHVDIPDWRDFEWVLAPRTKPLPLAVDLSPNFPFPPFDQGSLGSCTGNAGVGAMTYAEVRQKIEPVVMLSRLFCYYNSRDDKDNDTGATIRDTIKAINRYGLPPEETWPYDIDRFTVKPSKDAYEQASHRQALHYARVPQTLDAFKSVLADGHPIVIGFSVYESFEADETTRTGNADLPGPGESLLGGHAVVVCGYDDSTERFHLRNSWGEGWGDRGYFTLPYEYLMNPDLAEDFWVITLMEDPSDASQPLHQEG